jgi:hypothetical protein
MEYREQTIARLTRELGREPTAEEIKAKAGFAASTNGCTAYQRQLSPAADMPAPLA